MYFVPGTPLNELVSSLQENIVDVAEAEKKLQNIAHFVDLLEGAERLEACCQGAEKLYELLSNAKLKDTSYRLACAYFRSITKEAYAVDQKAADSRLGGLINPWRVIWPDTVIL